MCDCGCEALNGIPEDDEIPMWETPIYAQMVYENLPLRWVTGIQKVDDVAWDKVITGGVWATRGESKWGFTRASNSHPLDWLAP